MMGILVFVLLALIVGMISGFVIQSLRARGFSENSCQAVRAFTIIILVFFAAYHERTSKKVESKPGDIIVGTSADFPPFSFIENGRMVGFDVDLIEEVARRLGTSIELKNMPFSTLLPALQLGTMHIVVAGLTATPERAKHVLFTQPYLEGEPLVIVSLKTAPLAAVQDLQGKEVVVNQGYTADTYVSAMSGVHVRRLKSPADAFLALTSGRANAFVTAKNTVKPFFDQHGHDTFTFAVIPGTQENSAMAVAPQYQGLHEQVERVLEDMKKDGAVEKLRTKWGL